MIRQKRSFFLSFGPIVRWWILAALATTLVHADSVYSEKLDSSATLDPIWPKCLEPGDTIMFVAPAGDLDKERTLLAEKRLQERGYRVIRDPGLFSQYGYLAGEDERRAKELMQAFVDPNVDAVFPGTGGYGTMRILDQLDYDAIRANAKPFIGFSDITALHLALNRYAGLVTFHSPNPLWGLGSEENIAPFSGNYFFQAVERGTGPEGYVIEVPAEAPQPIALGKEGRVQGRLTGGNLSLIAALMGTPYEIDTRDAILMIEDTREAPYRIDRMLRQLQMAGKLATLRGAVLGQFTKNYDREKDQLTDDERFSVNGVLRQYFEPLDIPVLMNYPVGHHKQNATMPLGGLVEVDTEKVELRILPAE